MHPLCNCSTLPQHTRQLQNVKGATKQPSAAAFVDAAVALAPSAVVTGPARGALNSFAAAACAKGGQQAINFEDLRTRCYIRS